MNKSILNAEIQEYINWHLHKDITKLLLGKSPFATITTKELAQQIDSKNRCQKKLPVWFNTPGIYFPPKLNIEQSSSEFTATYKSKLAKGETLIDLTGGFGVDAFYFSKEVKQVYYVEQNEELAAVALHNAAVLHVSNIHFINHDSIAFLNASNLKFDTIYIDPARRIENKKVFLLKDTEPDVVTNLPFFLGKASRIIIKTSPLFDIQSGLNELSHVSEIHIVSVKNDCKELLWVIDKGFTGEPEIFCTALSNQDQETFSFKITEEKRQIISSFSEPLLYLYEPDVSLLKGGGFKTIANYYNLNKININTHLYTSKTMSYNFVGRTFKVMQHMLFKDFGKWNNIKKANIISRNFPLSPDEIKKKFTIQDGGNEYLIFCTGAANQLLVIHAQRI